MALAGDGGLRVPAPRCEDWPHGLVTVAEMDQRTDTAWLRGLEFDDEVCASGSPRAISMQCPPVTEQMMSGIRGFTTTYSDPFVVYEGYDCSAAGAEPLSAAWDHVDARLARNWQPGLERAFWTGEDQDGNTFRMSLAGGGAAEPNGAAAVEVSRAVELLEQWMADQAACLPTLHASVGVGPHMARRALAKEDGAGVLRTTSGSRVALGSGYPRTGPSGAAAAAGTAWMFASGPVKVLAGPVMHVPDRGDNAAAVDRAVNDVAVFALRPFATMYACGLAAVKVDLTA